MLSRRFVALATSLVAVGGLSQLPPAAGAPPTAAPGSSPVSSPRRVDPALGNGLGRLVAQRGTAGRVGGSGLRIDQSSVSIRDDRGRVLIDLTPQAGADRAVFRRDAQSLGLEVTATDPDQGTLEGYAPLSAIKPLAALEETGTIVQAVKPQTRVGAATSQGVALQRIDKVQAKGIRGEGMTVGVLSDSYDTAETALTGGPLTDHAADDVASGDLPGTGNPQNSQPVVVLSDGSDQDTDEGRAMLQIVHDIAPDAKLCFAKAGDGLVGFADNIRKLADKSGPCGADVIVDDVGFGDETPYVDNVVSDAIDEVTAEGATYLSAAGNAGDHQAWSAPLNLVHKAAARRAHLDFSHVDPSLYAGGLEDMDPGRGVDVAQTIHLDPQAGTQLLLYWNDPVDSDGAQLGDPYFEQTGEITEADPEPSFEFTPTADQLGKEVLVTTDGIPSGSTDLILDLVKPDGTEVGPVDTGASPERLATTLDQEGRYTITVSGFDGATGDFDVDVRPVVAPSKVTTDFNLLLFAPDGSYLGSFGDDNTLTGRPQEVLPIGGLPRFQLVVARKTTGHTSVSQLSYQLWGEGYVDDHFSPRAPSIVGHPMARGAIAVAAYDPFKSFLPEPYTSAGGKLPVYFDSDGDAYPTPQVRRKPDVAATDRANSTFFVADDLRDPDELPNFGGTSAAAPHAAGIAALVLQKAGGPGSLTPAQVRKRLESSAFAHDLDPFRSHGSRRGLRVRAVGDQGDERDLVPGSLTDRRFFRISYHGRVPLRSITFLGETASPTSLAGLVFDPRKTAARGSYREGGFPFRIGGTGGGLRKKSISARFSDRTGGTLPKGVFRHLTVRFRSGLKRGQSLAFGVDRDAARWAPGVPAIEGNGADELGGAVALPSGTRRAKGLRFRAVRADGTVITGRMVNRLGNGWTRVDGYGVIDAERAVLGGH